MYKIIANKKQFFSCRVLQSTKRNRSTLAKSFPRAEEVWEDKGQGGEEDVESSHMVDPRLYHTVSNRTSRINIELPPSSTNVKTKIRCITVMQNRQEWEILGDFHLLLRVIHCIYYEEESWCLMHLASHYFMIGPQNTERCRLCSKVIIVGFWDIRNYWGKIRIVC